MQRDKNVFSQLSLSTNASPNNTLALEGEARVFSTLSESLGPVDSEPQGLWSLLSQMKNIESRF